MNIATEKQSKYLKALAEQAGFKSVIELKNQVYGNPCEYLTVGRASSLIEQLKSGDLVPEQEVVEEKHSNRECESCGCSVDHTGECEQGCVDTGYNS